MRYFLAFTVLCVAALCHSTAGAGVTQSVNASVSAGAVIARQPTRIMSGRVFGVDASASTSADAMQAENWLAEKVCVDKAGDLGRLDPYTTANPFGDACPAGYSIRNLRETDYVPYYKYYRPVAGDANMTHYRYTNAYETRDSEGKPLFVMDRQFQPSNVPSDWYVRQSYYPGSTHWDAYEIRDGLVSTVATRDNTGLNQTFYGNTNDATTPFNGWLSFPTSYPLEPHPQTQSTFLPVHGLYWEQSGLPWPSQAPHVSQHDPDTQTTWKLIAGYRFDSGKTMNTIVSYHQSRPQAANDDPDTGHMEVWFFTVPYGPTRWEVWSAAACLLSTCRSYVRSSCNGDSAPMNFPYKGKNYTYYRTNCVDWEQGVAQARDGSTVPTLPLPQENLLADFHFSSDLSDSSQNAAHWDVGSSLAFARLQSRSNGDTRNGRYAGLRYAEISCRSVCSSSTSLSQSIADMGSGTYSYGAEVEAASSIGQIEVSLAQLAANGAVLGSPSVVKASVDAHGDGSNCSSPGGIENCAVYVGERRHVTLQPNAVRLRVSVVPLTRGIRFDVTDVFLSRV